MEDFLLQSTQQFSIACSLASSTFMEIECYDQSGKLVFEKRSEGKQLNIPIDCQGWQNGVYLIKGIEGNNQLISSRKIIKL